MRLGRSEIGIYLDALKAAGKDPARYSIVNNRVVYIADSADQAWAKRATRSDVSSRALRQMALGGGRTPLTRARC